MLRRVSGHAVEADWYQKAFPLESADLPWAERTAQQIEYLVDVLELSGKERVLDLACGVGRHSIELARRGHSVVGVDLSQEMIAYARDCAQQDELQVEFICADLRNLTFADEFDVVLNMLDGAVGYFENDEENEKTFGVIARALRRAGKSLINIPNIEFARQNYPMKSWEQGSKAIEILEFDWDEETRTMFGSTSPIRFGQIFDRLEPIRAAQRLYSSDELTRIFAPLDVEVRRVCTAPSGDDYVYVLSEKL